MPQVGADRLREWPTSGVPVHGVAASLGEEDGNAVIRGPDSGWVVGNPLASSRPSPEEQAVALGMLRRASRGDGLPPHPRNFASFQAFQTTF